MKDTFKVVVIGPAKVGKTTLVRRLRGLEPTTNYLATVGGEVHPVKITVDQLTGCASEICLIIWDCAGDPKFIGLADGYYINADLAIILFKTEEDRALSVQDYKRVRNTRTLCIQADVAREMSVPELQMEIYKKLLVKGGVIPMRQPSETNGELPLEQESNEISKLNEIIKDQEERIKVLERQWLISSNQLTVFAKELNISDKKYSDLVTMLKSILDFAK